MAIVQKTIDLSVRITIEVEEDLIGTDGVDDLFNMADNVAIALEQLNDQSELFVGGVVKEFSAEVIGVEDTNYQYTHCSTLCDQM